MKPSCAAQSALAAALAIGLLVTPAAAEDASQASPRFEGAWHGLDAELGCEPDRAVNFTGGKASYQDAEGVTEVPYEFHDDAESGLRSLVAKFDGEYEVVYWLAGPDHLLAMYEDGFEILARCAE